MPPSESSFNTKTAVLIGDSGATTDGSTKTQMYARCPKMHQYAYVRGISIPRSQNPGYFSVGSIFGAVRSAWFGMKFATGAKAAVVLKHAAQKEAERNKLPIAQKDEAYALALFDQYIEYWSQRPMPKPVATEFHVGPEPELDRTGSLDDLSYYPEAGGALAIGECKTTAGDISTSVREYEFHIQTMQYQALYLLNKGAQKKYGPVKGHVLDVTQKPEGKGKKPKFARIFIEVREEAIRTFIRSTAALVAQSKTQTWDSSPIRTYQCTFQAGRARIDCTYKNLCRYGKSGAARFVLADGSSLASHKPTKGKEKMPWE